MNQFDKKILFNSENKTAHKTPQSKNLTKKQIMEYIGFAKFKNRLSTLRIVESLLLTVGVAFLVCGATLILTVLDIWSVSPWLSPLFMVIAGGITFPCIFLSLSISNERLALKLDERFSLKERMQTSYENASNHSPMSVLLRQDLKSKTEKISSSKIKSKGLIACIIVAAIGFATLTAGCCVLVVSLVTGAQKPDDSLPPPSPPIVEAWELSAEQELALNEFVTMVEDSNMVSPAKEELAEKIKGLIATLKETTKEKDAIVAVELCVERMDEITFKTGSSGAIYNALINKETAFARELARALTRNQKSGYDQKMADALVSLKHKYESLEDKTKDQQTAMRLDTIDLLESVISDVGASLEESGVDKSDKLYELITEILNSEDRGLATALFMLDELSLSYQVVMDMIEVELWDTVLINSNIFHALGEQRKNYDVGYGASDGIRELFGLALPQREDLSSERPSGDDEDVKEDEKQDSAGGYGPGEILGTDELIYVKEIGNTIITYTIYNDNKEQMIKIFGVEIKDENGEVIETEISPEMEKYFELLLKGYEGEK